MISHHLFLGVLLVVTGLLIGITAAVNPNRSHWRSVAALCCAIAVLVYSAWRLGTFTLPAAYGWPEKIGIFALLSLELIVYFDFLIFLLGMSRITDHLAKADDYEQRLRAMDENDLPEIDIFVATYNEEWEILERTLLGIQAIDYPKKSIWVCDDGQRDWLKTNCEAMGVGYLRRSDSEHKKPGNHNFALSQTSAPYIAVFDADFIPLPNFLFRTIGFFEDPSVGVVQTPQSFYNYDPMRSNLLLHHVVPDDTDMFFRVMQRCRDAWNCAFYVGSSAVLRREALEAIGGVVAGHDTEDQITSIAMFRHGYLTRFVGEMLSIGLAPESSKALFEQRKRWARGSLQILFSPHHPLSRGLTMIQRIMFSQTFWLVGFLCPIGFAFAPLMILLLEWRLFPDAPAWLLMVMPGLLFLCINLSVRWLSNRLWVPLISPALQLFLSFRLLPTVLTTLLKPHGKPLLNIIDVTPKGGAARDSYRVDWITLIPLLVIVAGTLYGLFKILNGSMGLTLSPGMVSAVVFWAAVNLVIVCCAALICVEVPYQRREQRFVLEEGVLLERDSQRVTMQVIDISMISFRAKGNLAGINKGEELRCLIRGVGHIPVKLLLIRGPDEAVFQIEHLPVGQRHALFRKIFLNPDSHDKPLQGLRMLLTSMTRRFLRSHGSIAGRKPRN